MNDIPLVPSPRVERVRVRGKGYNFHPFLSPPPSRGRRLVWIPTL